MMFLILSGNPKSDGLCRETTRAVERGAAAGGAQVRTLEMDGIARCHVCGDGWGTCREQRVCAWGGDGFDDVQQAVAETDALCLVTPVYWSEMAEGLKCFTDRFRRCEQALAGPGALDKKPVLLVASAGGGGNGLPECLAQMERFCRHTGAAPFDMIAVNRWNSGYKKKAAHAAALAMAEGRRPGDTAE